MFPKFRENIWHIDPEKETAMLMTSRAVFNVPTAAALHFLEVRSYCTGSHSIDSISKKSGLPPADVVALLKSLEPADIMYIQPSPNEPLTDDHVRDVLIRACRVWSGELRMSYIGNEFSAGHLPKTVLIGWLLEMYHYIKDFPSAIEHGTRGATGRLRSLIEKYSEQEQGHEIFVLQTLVNLGLSEVEVKASIPLISTRLIGLLMRELFEIEPSAVLMVASIVEAQEFVEENIEEFKRSLHKHYGIGLHAFDPYFKHQQIDVDFGHAGLLSSNLDLVRINDREVLDQLVNKIHDLKHAFDLQSLEIKSYFTALHGKYIPRQAVDFASI